MKNSNTVNDELRSRNGEMTQINNDLTNVLASINIAVLMVASDLTIRRFTPQAQKILGLIPTDIGRPIHNINLTIEIPEFQSVVRDVMANFQTVEKEASDGRGMRYQVRVLPYRTLDHKVDGCVITLVDLSPNEKFGSRSAQRSSESDEKRIEGKPTAG